MMASADWIPSFNATMSVFRGSVPQSNVQPDLSSKRYCANFQSPPRQEDQRHADMVNEVNRMISGRPTPLPTSIDGAPGPPYHGGVSIPPLASRDHSCTRP